MQLSLFQEPLRYFKFTSEGITDEIVTSRLPALISSLSCSRGGNFYHAFVNKPLFEAKK
jgi:hypothetical protein